MPASISGMETADQADRFLLCRIGSSIGALAIEIVRETMRPLPIVPVAGAPSFVLGLAIVRGAPVPVIDGSGLLGTPRSSPTRFVTLKVGERTAALAVDAVVDIRSLPRATLAEIPPLLQAGDRNAASLIGALDAKLLAVLETARLVPDSFWRSLSVREGGE
jgi:purine-binding chemotaxis protein CheW